MDNKLILDINDHIATIRLNRPDAYNTLDVEMLETLPDILCKLADDTQIRCVVITGTGDKAFCAGGDVSGLASGTGEVKENELSEQLVQWGQASLLLREMPKPSLAVVNGAVAGAGMALALACDFRLASHNAHFTTAFSNLAMSGDFGGSYFLTQIVGTAKARELYYFSEHVSSEEALRLGLVNWLCDSDKLTAKTAELTERLTAIPALTASTIKDNMNASLSYSAKDMIDKESYSMIKTAMSKETQQAAIEFFAKKK